MMLQKINSIIILIAIFTIYPVFADSEGNHKSEEESGHLEDGLLSLEHIHSIDFYRDNPLVATHHGLIQYVDGGWKQVNSKEHDYMGFSLTKDGFYASGHPDPSTSLKDPLGIVWSDNMGNNLQPVAYYGELDFHWLTAGFNTDYLYAYTSDSTITTPAGFYYSENKGRKWQKFSLQGVGGKLITFKAHPQINGALFMSTTMGIFLSLDKGENFFLLLDDLESGALAISIDGKYLYSGTKKLTRLEISSKSQTYIAIPQFALNEKLTNIAVSPTDESQILISTNELNMFITYDNGDNWDQLLFGGI